jgi:hypothetical protein
MKLPFTNTALTPAVCTALNQLLQQAVLSLYAANYLSYTYTACIRAAIKFQMATGPDYETIELYMGAAEVHHFVIK